MAPTPGGPALPEVDEVDEGLGAAAAHEAARVPLPGVAGQGGVHHGAVPGHLLLAAGTALRDRDSAQGWEWWGGHSKAVLDPTTGAPSAAPTGKAPRDLQCMGTGGRGAHF